MVTDMDKLIGQLMLLNHIFYINGIKSSVCLLYFGNSINQSSPEVDHLSLFQCMAELMRFTLCVSVCVYVFVHINIYIYIYIDNTFHILL